jgi:transcriptional regulator with XRE-family HTH domain
MEPPAHVAGHLAHNLAALRHARALTQDALAKAAGVPRSTIANLESGDGNPSLIVLVKVAQALGAPIDELLAPPRAEALVEELRDSAELPEVVSALDRGDVDAALAWIVDAVPGASSDTRERLREVAVALFEQLGPEHPVAVGYRRRLATALY